MVAGDGMMAGGGAAPRGCGVTGRMEGCAGMMGGIADGAESEGRRHEARP